MDQKVRYYSERMDDLSAKIKELSIQLRVIGITRLLFFAGIIAAFSFFGFGLWGWVLAGGSLVLFLASVKVYINFDRERKRKQLVYDFYQKHNDALQSWNFTAFETGSDLQKGDHAYAQDLKIFGSHSLFQMLNRCHAAFGQKYLAREFTNLETDSQKIKQKQEAVVELSKDLSFLEQLYILFHEKKMGDDEFSSLRQWLDVEISSKRIGYLKFAVFAQVGLVMATMALTIFFGWPSSFYGLPFISMVLLIQPFFRQISRLVNKTDKLSDFLGSLNHLFELLEQKHFQSEGLQQEQQKLLNTNASGETQKLLKAFELLEYRNNPIVGFILNYTCLWDALSLLRINKHRKLFNQHMDVWLDALQTFDGLSSLGRAAFDFEAQTTFPVFVGQDRFQLEAKNMGHPFIDQKKRVNNSVSFRADGEVKIITGANMAGKSTFLRTIGVNLVMASTGLPVFADEFAYCPGYLFTSMLAADDLSSETSYFLAEVERLVLMMDYVKAHPNTLLILDEILKGTNSHDKEEGSKLFIERLISEQATALIATHDVNLTSMDQTYPQITNHSFEVEHIKGEMVFDFKLRNGVVQNLNAMELMKIKGLLPQA